METLSEKLRRDIVVQFYKEYSDRGECFTIDHLMRMKMKRSTLYDILGRYERRKTTKRKRGSGRTAQKLPVLKKRQLKRAANDKKGVSHRKLAAKFNVSRSYIGKVLRSQNVKYFKRQKCPDSTPEQQTRQIKCLRSMNRKLCPPKSDVVIILDDESYFPLKHDEMPGNDGFYSDNKNNTPFSVKYKTKQKFALKVMIWLAISERGHSDVYVKPSGLAINCRVYIDECIRARLVPFINKLHKDDEILFSPDLASSHYSIATRACNKELGINFVPKEMNPPNVPQLRPIENFGEFLKQRSIKVLGRPKA